MKSILMTRQLVAAKLGLCFALVFASHSLFASPDKQSPDSVAQAIVVSNKNVITVHLEQSTEQFYAGAKPKEQLVLAQKSRGEDEESPNSGKVAPGSPDEAVLNFCTAVADDNTATASDYISSTARGLAEQMREGTMTEERISDFVKFLNPFSELKPVPEPPSGSKRTLRNAKGQTMTFTVRKEKEVYKITEVTLTKAKK